MTDIFAALGVDTTGGEFVRVEEKYTDKQVQINVVSKLKELGVPMSDDYLYRTFDVEKPDDYDALKRDIEATRIAAEERASSFADQLNRQQPSNEEKMRFFDRFKRFFGLAPQDGAPGDPLPF